MHLANWRSHKLISSWLGEPSSIDYWLRLFAKPFWTEFRNWDHLPVHYRLFQWQRTNVNTYTKCKKATVYIYFRGLSKRIVIMHFNNEMTMQVSCVTVIFFPDILSLVHANVNIRYSRTEWVTVSRLKKCL